MNTTGRPCFISSGTRALYTTRRHQIHKWSLQWLHTFLPFSPGLLDRESVKTRIFYGQLLWFFPILLKYVIYLGKIGLTFFTNAFRQFGWSNGFNNLTRFMTHNVRAYPHSQILQLVFFVFVSSIRWTPRQPRVWALGISFISLNISYSWNLIYRCAHLWIYTECIKFPINYACTKCEHIWLLLCFNINLLLFQVSFWRVENGGLEENV